MTNYRLLLLSIFACACSASSRPASTEQLAERLANALHTACPAASPSDERERDRCAERLGDLPELRASLSDPVLWGAQSDGAGYDITKSNTTEFNPLAFRRGYLATFGFTGDHHVEHDAETTILHTAVSFRNELDPGAYPYPFWHSDKKWRSYQQTRELLFFFRDRKVVAVLRSNQLDANRTLVEHAWDGNWTWQSQQGVLEPHVSLFSYLLSPDNPHVAELEQAYRSFEQVQRTAACGSCHSPANPSAINPLYMLTYPGQALAARHELVQRLEQNTMPPEGLRDEGLRLELVALAKRFRDTGDAALTFEGEL